MNVIRTNAIPTAETPELATLLMLHHLTLAAKYFEDTHDDDGAYAKGLVLNLAPIDPPAMNAFIDKLVTTYAEMFEDHNV